jgi:hypothetical protein
MAKATTKKHKTDAPRATNVIRLPAVKKNQSALHALDNADLELNVMDPNSEDSSSTDESDESSSEEEEQDEEDPHPNVLTPPSTSSKKRKRKDLGECMRSIFTELTDYFADPEPECVKKVTYILSILSANEAKKTPAKRETKTGSVRLNTDKPWDTVKAQILVKIDAALHPKPLEFINYDINYYIARVLPKPGLSLMSDEDYDMLMDRVKSMKSKDPEVHISVVEKKNDENKENVDATGGDLDDVEEAPKSKGKKVRQTAPLHFAYSDLPILKDTERSCYITWKCE